MTNDQLMNDNNQFSLFPLSPSEQEATGQFNFLAVIFFTCCWFKKTPEINKTYKLYATFHIHFMKSCTFTAII